MHRLWLVGFGSGLVSLLGSGCGAPEKLFEIRSFPPGAMIYVDDRDQGQTDKKVLVDFRRKPQVTVRLTKDGYQPTGKELDRESPDKHTFFLQESPKNKEIIEVLNRIQSTLVQISDQLGRGLAEKNK